MPQGVAPDAPLSGTHSGIPRKLHFPQAKLPLRGRKIPRVPRPVGEVPGSRQGESDRAQSSDPGKARRPPDPGRAPPPSRTAAGTLSEQSGQPEPTGFMTAHLQQFPAIRMSPRSNSKAPDRSRAARTGSRPGHAWSAAGGRWVTPDHDPAMPALHTGRPASRPDRPGHPDPHPLRRAGSDWRGRPGPGRSAPRPGSPPTPGTDRPALRSTRDGVWFGGTQGSRSRPCHVGYGGGRRPPDSMVDPASRDGEFGLPGSSPELKLGTTARPAGSRAMSLEVKSSGWVPTKQPDLDPQPGRRTARLTFQPRCPGPPRVTPHDPIVP